ncbi:hypothetical protein [Limnoglobus roseus]|uniref:Uncharacterized protein n=1 Tax=Limnoglobus roseus TaxID=2598579 RepID=A0A5C1A662_9BACT|nr:hypothetical protein [Limnoglobus roseus]QEL14180.1 hypothetical protein PX52LOC_01050 [Limnoglobus roseus]
MTNEHLLPKSALWQATWFCAALSAITLIGMIVLYATSGGAHPGMLPVFLCNLPLAFMFAAYPVKRAHERIQALENRLSELEAAQATR